MKKIYSLLFSALLISSVGFSQTILQSYNFDNYDGHLDSIPVGLYISWNDSTKSFYNTPSSSGIAPNSYKFGLDSSTITTSTFTGADSVKFWYKFNGSGLNSYFKVYESADSSTFTLMDSISPLSTSEKTIVLPVQSTSHYLKFFYHKAGGNVAFDDLVIFNNVGLGVKKQEPLKRLAMYPNPSTTGVFTLDLGSVSTQLAAVEIYNFIGVKVFGKEIPSYGLSELTLDLSMLPRGSYFATIKTNQEQKTMRLLINK